MRLCGSVDAVDKLSRQEVSQVLHCVWGGVYVVMPPLTMVTEAMRMLHSQVKTLWIGNKRNELVWNI